MGLPEVHFDNDGRVLPRQPIPVRYAILAAGWTPALFAEIVRGLGDWPPLLTVYAFDSVTDHVGEVRGDAYDKFRDLKVPLPVALAEIPPNHFVWSDDLEFAYSEYIDLTMDRGTAREEGMGIVWKPDLANCGAVVADAADLSPLRKPGKNRSFVTNRVRTFEFDSRSVQLKDSTGFRYISYLLFRPGTKVSVQDLDRAVRPPVGDHDLAPVDADSADQLQVEDPRNSSGEEMQDKQAIQDIKKKLEQLQEKYDDLHERGLHDKARLVAEEMNQIRRHLLASRDRHGRSRRLGSEADRIRKSIGNAIARALDSLQNVHPSLAKHLRETMETGFDCIYRPSESIQWSA